jgi:hypothetical protein
MQAGVWFFTQLLHHPELEEALELSELAVRVDRDGAGPGSLTEDGLHYSVVDGKAIQGESPGFWRWIERRIPPVASATAGKAMHLSPHVPSAINVNVLEGVGEQYEPHTDSCPYTMILFANTLDVGGALALSLDGGVVYVQPKAGTGVLFDGYSIPHWVEPLMRPGDRRVTVPVALYPIYAVVQRDDELDGHLYAA